MTARGAPARSRGAAARSRGTPARFLRCLSGSIGLSGPIGPSPIGPAWVAGPGNGREDQEPDSADLSGLAPAPLRGAGDPWPQHGDAAQLQAGQPYGVMCDPKRKLMRKRMASIQRTK